MKISWLINLFPPYLMGGNEILAQKVILELRARGHEVYVLTGRGENLPCDDYHRSPVNFDLDRMGERFLGTRAPSLYESVRWHIFDFNTYRAIVHTLKHLRPDLTVVDNFSLISVAPLIAAARAKSKIVVQANDKWLIYGLRSPGQGLWHTPQKHASIVASMQSFMQPIFRAMTGQIPILVNSQFLKDAYIQSGFEPEQLRIIHLGIDVDTYQPSPHQNTQLGAPIRLMYASQLWAGKGAQIAIQALAELKRLAPETTFAIDVFGDGAPDFKNYLIQLATDLEVNDRVNYFGFVSPTQLAEAFHDHDVFLFTSIWDEPFSLTLLSAMSCGIPVVSTSVGGNQEAVEHERTGLLVPPGDPLALAQAILKLVRDSSLRCRISGQASDTVRERWSFRRYVDKLEAAYRTYAMGN
jgi:glycosyltransferase involved in cell wall biosynthesis